MIPAIIAAAASIGSSIWGAISANKRRNKAEEAMRKKKQDLREWRDREMNSNYVDRADSQAALRKVKEYNKEALDAMNTNAVRSGATDEAKVAAAGRLGKGYAGAVSQIAGLGAHHKDRVQGQYLNATANLDGLEIGNLMDSSGVQNMVSGVANAAGQIGSLYSMYGKAGKAGNTSNMSTATGTKNMLPAGKLVQDDPYMNLV